MAINLATKYSPKIVEAFTLNSVVMGKAKAKYDWDGVRTVKVYNIVTVPMTDYDVSKTSNRFGNPTELQDEEQTMTVTRNRSFSLIIDKQNNTSQMMVKNAGRVMKAQMDEQMIPEYDAYCLKAWAEDANVTKVNDGSLTKSNIVEKVAAGITSFVNNKVPLTGNYLFIGASNYAKLILSPEFLNLDKLGTKALEKGVCGEFQEQQVVRVPDSYLPEGVNFILAHGDALVAPTKIKTLRILEDVQGIDGAVLEGRQMYDAFVLAKKAKGVYVSTTA